MRPVRCLIVALLLTIAAALPATATAHHATTYPTLNGILVKGNQLVDATGNVIHLQGVNRSGTEYACIQGWSISDGPDTAASLKAMATWNINIVRVPLNEDCWLGVNRTPVTDESYSCAAKTTLPKRFYGAAYRKAVEAYVKLIHSFGMYAEVSLIWGAPGKCRATYQPNGPDESHSPAMWKSMAIAFKDDPNVILAPWGETTTGWSCFMHGCSNQATFGPHNKGYPTAGMQQAVKVMRKAGYKGVISIPCIDYANSCADYDGSSWSQSHPTDPDHNLIAEAHVYGNNGCGAQDNGSCLQTQYGNLAATVPVIWGETGETYDDHDCTSANMQILLPWADTHISGYMAWTWDTWGDCLSLIKDFTTATPSDAYATYIHDHYISLEKA